MGNGVSTDQGNLPPHGTRDVRQSEDEEQHDWSQLAEAPNTNSALLAVRKPYRGRIYHTSPVIANFLLKFSNFRCRGNRGWSGANFNSTAKFADPDKPLLGSGKGVVSPTQAQLLPIFC